MWRRVAWYIDINVSEEPTAGISRQARTLKMETAGEIITPQPTVRKFGGFYKRRAPTAHITPAHDFQVTSTLCFNSNINK